MSTAKQAVEELLQDLPDDCTLEEIVDHIGVLAKVLEGEQALAAGEKVSLGEAWEQLRHWLAPG